MKTAVILVVSLALLGISPSFAGEVAPRKIDEKAAAATAAASNALARDLYGALRSRDGNLFFSPYSIHAALMMAREGARGETAAQMDRVLHLRREDRGGGYKALRASLRPGSYEEGSGGRARKVSFYELDIANAVWGQRRYFIKNTFLHPLRDVYGAPLKRVDFDDRPAARRIINRWAAQATRNKIKDVIPRNMPRPKTRLMLTNAVYFKASWAEEFNASATKPDLFTGPGGKKQRVPMMWQVESHGYAEIDGVQIVDLPYMAAETSMVVFLPRAADGLAALEEKLRDDALGDWAQALEGRRVDLKLPRFKFSSQFALREALSAVGMADAFDPSKADFEGVTEAEGLFLGGVVHKTFVSVDEKGTEAAAVTAMDACAADAAPAKPVVFRADHPFVFLIRHVKTGTVLFLGRVTDPNAP